ncbi:hypothetical protein [Pseudoflavonifractor capillosus]|uniref:hypothetical protein n=1 Tax=Pseudoflavonifractor capillosus TaxID=106588 RepID=UPI0023F8B464|nr:hypothetical protein [Pseudoflavonifractor capillosus]
MINAAKSVILPSSIKREITLNFLFLFEPSQASLCDASSPEGGAFFCAPAACPFHAEGAAARDIAHWRNAPERVLG